MSKFETAVRKLRSEAAEAGDEAMVATCDAALQGDPKACGKVADVLSQVAYETAMGRDG